MSNSAKKVVDPITVEVIRNSLISVSEEMRVTVERTAYSPVISEVVDFCCGIVDIEYRSVAETVAIPVFIGNLSEALKEVDRIIGFENIIEGDIIFCNDPYSGGFSHNPDVTVLCPVFYGGSLRFFTGFKGHVLDLGGIYTGGAYNNTTETYQEGVMFPPVKLYKGGKPNEDIFRLIRRNSRLADTVLGDIRAMVSAVRVGSERLVFLLNKYTEPVFFDAVEEIFNAGTKIARKVMEAIPDGVHSGHFYCDGDGDDWKPLDCKIKVNVTITVKGDRMIVDLTGSSPQSRGPMNVPKQCVLSLVRYGFKAVTTPFLPNNEGYFEPLEIIIPKGSIFDPQMPAANSLLWVPSAGLPDLMLRLFTENAPEKSRGGHFGDLGSILIYGTDPRTGNYYLFPEATAGGWGGKPYEDGETMFCYLDGNTFNIPVEVAEVRYPIHVERYSLSNDSGGQGKFRGGLGICKRCTPIGHTAKVTATFDRQKYSPPWGVFGGKDGVTNRIVITRKDGSKKKYSKFTDLEIDDGDVISVQTGGGGGYGDPLERDPEKVKWDVINEYISIEAAREGYGIELNLMELEQLKGNK